MSALSPTIYARGDKTRLDAVLDLVAFAARPCPLSTSLDELPRRIAQLLEAQVCSLYLLEAGDLVMRGNVGFAREALGEVRLAVGEGITGMAVECMRPMALSAAPESAHFREFPALDEKRFPVFLAVPIAGPSGVLGALVLQREREPYSDHDVVLAAALTAPIAAALERAHLTDSTAPARRAPGGGTRRLTLTGRTGHPGRAVGAVYALRRPSARPTPEPARPVAELHKTLERTFALVSDAVDRYERRALELGLDASLLASARTIMQDGRLRDRALELAKKGAGLAHALTTVGGEVARHAQRSGDEFVVDRAREVGDVCEALAMLAASDRRLEVPRGAVLLGDSLTLFDLLVSARVHPAGVVLASRADGPMARTLVGLLQVPTVVDVAGLLRWLSEGDLVLLDADHGLVRTNPSRAEVLAVRAEHRRADDGDEP